MAQSWTDNYRDSQYDFKQAQGSNEQPDHSTYGSWLKAKTKERLGKLPQPDKPVTDEQMMAVVDNSPMGIGSILVGRHGAKNLGLDMNVLEEGWKRIEAGADRRTVFNETGAQNYMGKEGYMLDDLSKQFDAQKMDNMSDGMVENLGDLLKPDAQLLKAMPELKNMPIAIDERMGDNVVGIFQEFAGRSDQSLLDVGPGGLTIKSKDDIMTVAHELQHATDSIDMFKGDKTVRSAGSSTDSMDYSQDSEKFVARVNELVGGITPEERMRLFKSIDDYHFPLKGGRKDGAFEEANYELGERYPFEPSEGAGLQALENDVFALRPYNRYLLDSGEIIARRAEDMTGSGKTFIGDVRGERSIGGAFEPSDRIIDLFEEAD